jgi:enoyl-CoA hydratase
MVLTGRICTADEARVSGLVTHVYPHDTLMDEALALAELIAAKPPLAIAAAKELMNIALDDAQEVGLARELEAFAQSFATHDQREGMAAFFEKRPATFEGR